MSLFFFLNGFTMFGRETNVFRLIVLSQVIQSLAHYHNVCPERYQHKEVLRRQSEYNMKDCMRSLSKQWQKTQSETKIVFLRKEQLNRGKILGWLPGQVRLPPWNM